MLERIKTDVDGLLLFLIMKQKLSIYFSEIGLSFNFETKSSLFTSDFIFFNIFKILEIIEMIKTNVRRKQTSFGSKNKKSSVSAKSIGISFFLLSLVKGGLSSFLSSLYRFPNFENKILCILEKTCRNWTKLFTRTCYFSQVSRALKSTIGKIFGYNRRKICFVQSNMVSFDTIWLNHTFILKQIQSNFS